MSEPEEDISTTQRTGRISSEDTERDVRLREPPPDSGELETTRRSKPGGATDTVTSFIYREYRERSNVGYGTMLAFVYLVIIILFIVGLLKLANRWNSANATE